MKNETVETFDTLDFVKQLISDYTDPMHKAMDNNEENKVNQFHGSIVSLQILKDRLERAE